LAVWDNDFTTSPETVLLFPHPTEPADPSGYESHLLNIREPISGTPYQTYDRVIKQRFDDPDRNADDQVDISDLITRMDEVTSPTLP